jgi:hypothetical protein
MFDYYENWRWRRIHTEYTYHDIDLILRPLKMLRNVDHLEISEADGDDLPIHDPATANMSSMKSHNISPELQTQFANMVQEDTPAYHIFKMHEDELLPTRVI